MIAAIHVQYLWGSVRTSFTSMRDLVLLIHITMFAHIVDVTTGPPNPKPSTLDYTILHYAMLCYTISFLHYVICFILLDETRLD